MQRSLTAFLIVALVIVVNHNAVVAAQDESKPDQLVEETKSQPVTIFDDPKYVKQNKPIQPPTLVPHNHKPEQRPPSKPPNIPIPDKNGIKSYVGTSRPYYGQAVQQVPPPRHIFLPRPPNNLYKYPKVVPLPLHPRTYYYTQKSIPRPLIFATSTGHPYIVTGKSPKFSLPVQTINGIRTDFVKPPRILEKSINSPTTTTTTTTQRPLRTKRIWPKRLKKKFSMTVHNTTVTIDNKTATNNTSTSTNDTDHAMSASSHRFRYIHPNSTTPVTTTEPSTSTSKTRGYRRVTRVPKKKYTAPPSNFTRIEINDWIPIVPSHYRYPRLRRPAPIPIGKRSDVFATNAEAKRVRNKRTLYVQSFGLVPMSKAIRTLPNNGRKKMIYFRRKKLPLNPIMYSGYSAKPVVRSPAEFLTEDLQNAASSHPRVVTKIKHHHHHHHHRFIKTVEKPVKVPYKVEVPMPFPVKVEKKVFVPIEKIKLVDKPMPYPVTVTEKVPYPVEVKVPHPVPVKVVEKEYVPKPYPLPIVHHVPVVKHIEVKVPVPVDRPVPVPVTVEKKVPYPVPFKVIVPQPYPVETKVPYPVEVKVKEPYEVIRRIPVKVPYPHPIAVKVPQPIAVPVEKKVPYPVEVEKKVAVPVEVPKTVEVEKKVPVYVPKPYPVEKKVPVPVKVPYPVHIPIKVPVEVPLEVPVYIHYPMQSDERYVSAGIIISDQATPSPLHTKTAHGNGAFTGFQSRSDVTGLPGSTTTLTPES